MPPDPRVLVVCSDISQSDRIVEELSGIGLEPSPAFSAGEAVGLLARESFAAVVVDDTDAEGLPGLRGWLKTRYGRTVVFVGEEDARSSDDDYRRGVSEGPAVAAKVLAAMRKDRRLDSSN